MREWFSADELRVMARVGKPMFKVTGRHVAVGAGLGWLIGALIGLVLAS